MPGLPQKYFFRSSDYPTQSSTNFTASLSPPLTFHEDYAVALTAGTITNVDANISAGLNNNTFSYYSPVHSQNYSITIPDGIFDAAGLNAQLQLTLQANGDYAVVNGNTVWGINFVPNLNLDRIQIMLQANYSLNMSTGNFAIILGFTPQTITAGAVATMFTGTSAALFTNGTLYYYIYCDILSGGVNVNNQFQAGILRSVPGGAPGYAIDLTPANGIYYWIPLKSRNVSQINFIVYDYLLNVADLLGEVTGFELTFAPISSLLSQNIYGR